MATIRDKGACPCPRCFITKDEIGKLGHQRDKERRFSQARSYLSDVVNNAREHIYHKGFLVNSAGIERMLQPLSLVPTTVRLCQHLFSDVIL